MFPDHKDHFVNICRQIEVDIIFLVAAIRFIFFVSAGGVPTQNTKFSFASTVLTVGNDHGNPGCSVVAFIVGCPVGFVDNLVNSQG